ncbi:MAG: hypothetical protein JSR57_10210 [Verrucomicrobia bacterium]|nr:hypothetical protein [Verrucomicrobiota bacterium]
MPEEALAKNSNTPVEINAKMHAEATKILVEQGKIIEPNTLVLGFGKTGLSLGGSIPICYNSYKVLLSASHVAECFETTEQVRTLYKCDPITRYYPPKNCADFHIEKWDPNFDSKMLEKEILSTKPKDLAVITPAKCIDEITSHKTFYHLPTEKTAIPENLSSLALITIGCIEACNKDNVVEGMSTVLGVISSDYHEFSDCDYIVCTVDTNTYEIRELGKKRISSFRGLSGNGLWAITNGKPQLIGVAIAEDLTGYNTIGKGTIWFHGPKSIYAALQSWEQNHNLKS